MKQRGKFYFVILYALVVLLFSVVNRLLYRFDSTSFLITDQLNDHVIALNYVDEIINLESLKFSKDPVPININEYTDKIKLLYDKIDSIKTRLSNIRDKTDSLRDRRDTLLVHATKMREESIESYKNAELKASQHKIDSLRSFLEGKDSTEMILQGKYVELAQVEYEMALREYQIQSFIMENYGSFIPDYLMADYTNCNEAYMENKNEIQNMESNINRLATKIIESNKSFHAYRLKHVSFWDFLYYSICVSTTVSFGDIVPNNGLARFFAVLELLACIIILGALLEKTNQHLRKNNREFFTLQTTYLQCAGLRGAGI